MIIVTGSLAYDYIMDFPGKFADHILPDQLHNINLSFMVNKFDKRRGGTAGNISYTLALLHTPQILLSAAGKDFNEYAQAFTKLGIDTNHIAINNRIHTATGFAMTDKTDNQIWGFFNGAIANAAKLQLKTVANKDDFVVVGPNGVEGTMRMVKQSIKQRLPYLFDPGFTLTQISNDDLALGVTQANILIGNDYEINLIKERLSNYDKAIKGTIVVTTLGEKGALIETEGKQLTIKPVKAKKVIDPTGAGDAWRGGFLAGFERGFDLQTCGQMGAVAAVYAVEKYGTQEHHYTKNQFTKRYKEAYNKILEL